MERIDSDRSSSIFELVSSLYMKAVLVAEGACMWCVIPLVIPPLAKGELWWVFGGMTDFWRKWGYLADVKKLLLERS